MNKESLRRHIQNYKAVTAEQSGDESSGSRLEREEHVRFYQSFSKDKILQMTAEEVYEYLSRMWALLIWGNKHYFIDRIIEDNGLNNLRQNLADLVWGSEDIAPRWDRFRTRVKGFGPAMMSEILCKTFPEDFMVWNRRAYVALNHLQVENLPRYDYQLNGKVYRYLCEVCKEIAAELRRAEFEKANLLDADYFIWTELQVQDKLSELSPRRNVKENASKASVAEVVHDDIRDKLRDIGEWLGFSSKIELKVSEGAKVDTVWEATIGNMGRVIYVFEVQTRGSIDSLILNLLKSLKNSAVQGIVAVSDEKQLALIRREAEDIRELRDKLKYWDYREVALVHEQLESVNEVINRLGLVPTGF